VPAVRNSRIDPARQLGTGVRATSDRNTSLLGSGLIVFQVAISTMLLIGTGLFVRSLSHQVNVDLGGRPLVNEELADPLMVSKDLVKIDGVHLGPCHTDHEVRGSAEDLSNPREPAAASAGR